VSGCGAAQATAQRCTADPGPFQRRCAVRSTQVGFTRLARIERRSRVNPRSVSAAHHFVLRCARDTCCIHTRGIGPGRESPGGRATLFTLSNSHLSHAGQNPLPGTRIELHLSVPRCASHRAPGPHLLPSSAAPNRGAAERRQARVPCCWAARVSARRAPCDRCARLSALHRSKAMA
jgi:hypothetical protein